MLDTPLNIEDLDEQAPLVIPEFDAKAGRACGRDGAVSGPSGRGARHDNTAAAELRQNRPTDPSPPQPEARARETPVGKDRHAPVAAGVSSATVELLLVKSW